MKKLQRAPQEFTGVDEKGQRGGIPNNTSYNYWKHQKQSKSEKWPESPCRSSGSMVGSVAPCPGYTWGWDGLFHRPQSLTEGSQVGSWRRELKQGPWRRLLTGLCSPLSHIIRTISPGTAPLMMDWVLPHHLQLRKCLMTQPEASLDSKPHLRTPLSRWSSLCPKLTKQRTL